MAVSRPQVNISFIDPETIDESSSGGVSYDTQTALRSRVFALGMMLALLVIAVYGAALMGQFIYLDNENIVENLALRTWGPGLKAIWVHPTIWPQYQPAWYTALLLEYKLFGTRLPGGYIAVSILLHAANVILLWTLLRKLELPGALAAAALFAAHPLNVEAVAWISQQGIVLCGVFSLAATLVFLRHRGINPPPPSHGWLTLPESTAALFAWSIVLMLGAVASHPVGIALPLALLIVMWWERGRFLGKDAISLTPLAALSVIWLVVLMVADVRHVAYQVASVDQGTASRALVAPRAIFAYLGHLLLPGQLSFGYLNYSNVSVWTSVAFAAALLGVLLAGALRPRFGRGPLAATLLFVVLLIPAFIVRTDLREYSADLADHLAYLAAIVPLVAIAALIAPLPRMSRPPWFGAGIGAGVTIVLAVFSVMRLRDYRRAENLWAAALRSDPASISARNNLGLIELNQNHNINAAMQHFIDALRIDERSVTTLLNLANAHLEAKEPDRARMRFQQAVVVAPDNPDAHFGLAGILAAQKDSDGALREYQIVLKARPDHVLALCNIGLVHAERGEFEEAMASYENAIRLNPNFAIAYVNMANLLFERGVSGGDQALIQRAAAALEKAVAVDPSNFGVYLNAGAMVTRLSQGYAADEDERTTLLAQAERFFRKAVSLQPKSVEAHSNLAVALMLQSRVMTDRSLAGHRMDDAIYEWKLACELEPENQQLQENLAKAVAARASQN